MRIYQAFALILILAISFFPRQLDPKIIFFLGIYSLSLLPTFAKSIRQIFQEKEKRIVLYFFLFFLAVSLVSTIFSTDFSKSFPHLILYTASLITFVCSGTVFKSFQNKEKFAGILLFTTFLLSLISLYNTFIGNYTSRESEGVSFLWIYFGHNHLSSILIFAIPLGIYLISKESKNHLKRTIFIFISIALVLSLIFTFSIAAIISLLLSFIISLKLFKLSDARALFILAGLTSGLILAFFVSFKNFNSFGFSKPAVITNASRLLYIRDAIGNGLKHPFLGSGLNTYYSVSKNDLSLSLKTYYAHNFFFQMFSDAGIPGFVASILLVFSALFYFLKSISKKRSKEMMFFIMLWVGILASFFNTLFDFDWQLPTVFFIFWTLGGLF